MEGSCGHGNEPFGVGERLAASKEDSLPYSKLASQFISVQSKGINKSVHLIQNPRY